MILLLIQVGGLGIMTLATIGLVLLGRRIGLRRRVLGAADKGQEGTAFVKRLVFLVAVLTFAFEAIGTVIFALRLYGSYDYPPGRRSGTACSTRCRHSTTPASGCSRRTCRRSSRTGR